MSYWIASIIFIVFLVALMLLVYLYEEVLQIVISAGIGCLCICAGILSGAYLIFFIIGGVCLIFTAILYFSNRPLTRRKNNKKN